MKTVQEKRKLIVTTDKMDNGGRNSFEIGDILEVEREEAISNVSPYWVLKLNNGAVLFGKVSIDDKSICLDYLNKTCGSLFLEMAEIKEIYRVVTHLPKNVIYLN